MRGGRNFSSRATNYQRGGRGNSYRNNTSSNYRSENSSGRHGGQSNGRNNYAGGGNSSHYNNSSRDGGGRSRYESNRDSHDNRKSSYNSYSRDRNDSPARKRFRNEGGGSRRDFSRSSDHGRFENHNVSSSSYRSKKRSSPSTSARSPYRGWLPPKKINKVHRNSAATTRNVRRSRIVPARTSTRTIGRRRIAQREIDNVRRAKIAHLRSIIKKRGEKSTKTDDDGIDGDKKSKTDENGEKSADESEVHKKKSSSRSRPKKPTSTNGDNEGKQGEEEDGVNLDISALGEKNEKGVGNDATISDNEQENEEETENGGDGKKKERSSKKDKDTSDKEEPSHLRKKYIRLNCMHCKKYCVTFQDYSNHLHTRQHRLALRRISFDQKAKILKMRFVQRQAQREVDGDMKASTVETSFCTLCRLNYRSPKTEHQASKEHREMKKFLMPYCDICRVGFRSPMDYEVHRCSLEHIKCAFRKGVDPKKKNDKEDDEDELQVDLGEFTTVDSIGDIDYVQTNFVDDKDDKQDDSASNPDVLVGSEHVKKVEAYYCEICHYFLPRHKVVEESMKKHCNVRTHLKNYLRHKEDESLRLTAEKIHRRHQEEKGGSKDGKEADKGETAATEDEVGDDKVWQDVEKDLGDILQQASNTNEDEDEDSTTTTERYDRFKNSGKINESEGDKMESVDDIKKDDVGDEIKE